MVACYHPVYIFNRVSVCNHSCTKQMDLIKSRAYHYENTIEIGSGTLPLFPLYQELKQMDGIESISLSMSSVLYCWLRELPIRQTDGSIQHNSIAHIPTDTTSSKPCISGKLPEYLPPKPVGNILIRLLSMKSLRVC